MPNQGQFNSFLFNNGATGRGGLQIQDDLIFNGFGLQNDHFITQTINAWNMPSINLLTYTNPKSDGGGLLDRYFKERTIQIQGSILGESLEDTQNKIDNLKKALSVKQGYLDMKIGDTYRRILCSLVNSDIINRQTYDVEHGTFNLQFKALEPFWSEKIRDSELFANVDDDINEDIFNGGSEYSNPIINIVVKQASGVSEINIAIGDNEISINNNLQVGDILEINTVEKTVLKNTQSIDFSGKFPRLEAGVNLFSMTSDGDFEYDIAVLFPKNYL